MFSENSLELAKHPLSYSKLKVAKKCPFHFQKRYNERVKPTNQVEASSAVVGTTVHAVMENIIGSLQHESSINMDVVTQHLSGAFVKAAEQVPKLTSEEASRVMDHEDPIRQMALRIAKYGADNGCSVYIEEALAVDKELNPVPYNSSDAFFRGKIDLVMVMPSGLAAVIDYKTGYRNIKAHEEQMRTYEILVGYALAPKVKQNTGVELKAVRTALSFVADGAIDWFSMSTMKDIKTSRTNWFYNFVNGLSDKVKDGKVNRGSHCNQCRYRSYCGSKVGTRKKKKGPQDAKPKM